MENEEQSHGDGGGEAQGETPLMNEPINSSGEEVISIEGEQVLQQPQQETTTEDEKDQETMPILDSSEPEVAVAVAEPQDLNNSKEELITEDEKKISVEDGTLPNPESIEVTSQGDEANAKKADVVPDIKELTIKNLDTGEQYVIGENDPDFEFDTFPLTGDMGDGTTEGRSSQPLSHAF